MKIVLALWGADQQTLLGDDLRAALREAGATRLQVNLDDEHIPEAAMRLHHLEEPITTVVTIWTDGEDADALLEVVRPYARRLAGWQVEERQPLTPPPVPDGERADALAQVAFIRRPSDLPYADWLSHWHGRHTEVAIETQATFGYVQNRVTARLTEDTPEVAAVVEELFPTAAMGDMHAFYGSGGDRAELKRRLTELMASVAVMGADRDIDVAPTSRYVYDL